MRALAGLPLVILPVALAAAFAAACAGPTPATVTFGAGEAQSTSGDDDDSTSKSSSSNPANAANATTKTQSDPIFGASAFAAGTPKNGPAKGRAEHSAVNAQNDPSGADCMTCHASTFAFGGTVYADANGSARVAGAEIRVVGPDGQTFASGFSDADGNFWVDTTGTVMPDGSHVGVRNGSTEMTMVGKIGGANGNSCNASACHGSPTFRVNLH